MSKDEAPERIWAGWPQKIEYVRADIAAADAIEIVRKSIPTSWLDPMLSGPDTVLKGKGGTWGCPDIERLLQGVKARLTDALNAARNKETHDGSQSRWSPA